MIEKEYIPQHLRLDVELAIKALDSIEREIAILMLEGYEDLEIIRSLGITRGTYETKLLGLYQTLRLSLGQYYEC